MEEIFAQARAAESETEELLVDDGWKLVEVEPERVSVNGNGHRANANGQAAVTVNGNGHHDEEPEPLKSLLSWAELMAEPVKPKRRNGELQTASMSMFEWALEKEREAETVDAGR